MSEEVDDYVPVDVCSNALELACQNAACALPEVSLQPSVRNYVTHPLQLEPFSTRLDLRPEGHGKTVAVGTRSRLRTPCDASDVVGRDQNPPVTRELMSVIRRKPQMTPAISSRNLRGLFLMKAYAIATQHGLFERDT